MLKYNTFVNEEVGLKNLKSIVSGHKTSEIYFHKDLDGVCSALAMKYFLETYYKIKTVDCHQIQYGGMEFAVKHHKEGNLVCLVDFAHSKPMFQIATDHHDKQIGGAVDKKGTYFKPSRSNVETISGEISYSDVFTHEDIKLIQTVDSANFATFSLTPDDIQNSVFKYQKTLKGSENRFLMGFVVNRLLLAYKNKRISVTSLDGKNDHINRNILECLVLDSSPSLLSMFNNLRHYINSAKVSDKRGFLATPEDIMKNLQDYTSRMKDYKFVEDETGEVREYDPSNRRHMNAKRTTGVHFDEEYKIIRQYGGGSMYEPGSYDRYVPFKNFPEANFICLVWPMGLIQVSCNPFKEKVLKKINLGEISKEVMASHKPVLTKILVSLENVKKEFETSQDWKKMQKEEGSDYEGVGFKYSDLEAFYKDCVLKMENSKFEPVDINNDSLKSAMNKVYDKLSDSEKSILRQYKISIWELITRNSGGHPSITNLQGFGFLKYNKDALKIAYETEKYTDVMKKVAREFIDNLKDKIDKDKAGKNLEYDTKGVELSGHDTNENYEYFLINKSGNTSKVTKDEFINDQSMKTMLSKNNKPSIEIDNINKKVIAKFESFVSKKV